MPIYQYCCLNCGHEFEVIQKMGEHNPECPYCRGETRKLISNASFRLKGDGWANKGYQKGEK
jgi:putative FmdB family regulatory protein